MLPLLLFSMLIDGEMQYLDTFGDGNLVFGREDVVTDFAYLTSNTTLPQSFTICSSLQPTNLPTIASFFALLRSDGSPWISLTLSPPTNLTTVTRRVEVRVMWPDMLPRCRSRVVRAPRISMRKPCTCLWCPMPGSMLASPWTPAPASCWSSWMVSH